MMNPKDKNRIYDQYITTHFGKIHGRGDAEYETYYRYFKRNYLTHLPENKNSRIIDVGCGMGHFLFFLKNEGYKEYLGIDISRENIEFCKANDFNVELWNIFDFFEETKDVYDVIVMNDILEHFNKDEIFKILELVYARLNEKGRLILKVPNAANPILAGSSRYIDFTHETLFTEESLSQILNVVGFKDVQLFPQDIYIFYTNPLNYIAKAISYILNIFFRLLFILHGRKTTKIFTKDIISLAIK